MLKKTTKKFFSARVKCDKKFFSFLCICEEGNLHEKVCGDIENETER